jgi:hypothetical protein
MKITAEIFKQKTGEDPIHDDLERCNCPDAGKPSHQFCGWCTDHDKPRSRCGCPADKKKAAEDRNFNILKEVLGDYRVVDLLESEADGVWANLKGLKPFHETCSFHVGERQYHYQGKIYHVFFELGSDSDRPCSIGVRDYYEWAKDPTQ